MDNLSENGDGQMTHQNLQWTRKHTLWEVQELTSFSDTKDSPSANQFSIYLGLSKEVIDALLPWEKYGSWGGDGFSKYDLMYDILGILTAWGIDELIKPKKEKKKVDVTLDNNKVRLEWKF